MLFRSGWNSRYKLYAANSKRVRSFFSVISQPVFWYSIPAKPPLPVSDSGHGGAPGYPDAYAGGSWDSLSSIAGSIPAARSDGARQLVWYQRTWISCRKHDGSERKEKQNVSLPENRRLRPPAGRRSPAMDPRPVQRQIPHQRGRSQEEPLPAPSDAVLKPLAAGVHPFS